MDKDSDWVADVRRWYLDSQAGTAAPTSAASNDTDAELDAVGYEAANPVLQAQHWPGAVAD